MICEKCQADEKRSAAANRYMWPILDAWSKQKQWPINGAMSWLTKDDWKDILTAAFENETMPRLVPAWDSPGLVMLGRRTSKYGKKRFAEWIEWLNAASVMAGIRIPSFEYREAA